MSKRLRTSFKKLRLLKIRQVMKIAFGFGWQHRIRGTLHGAFLRLSWGPLAPPWGFLSHLGLSCGRSGCQKPRFRLGRLRKMVIEGVRCRALRWRIGDFVREGCKNITTTKGPDLRAVVSLRRNEHSGRIFERGHSATVGGCQQ